MVFLTCGPTPWYRQLTTLSSRLISSFWLKSSSCLAAWSANIVIIAGIELCGEQGGNIQQGQSHVKWTFGYTNPNSWPLPPLLRPRTIQKALYDLPCQCLLEGSILNNNGIGGWRDKGNMLAVCTILICPKNKGHSLGSWSHEPLFSEWDHVLGSPFADVILFTYNTRGVPSALNYKLSFPTLNELP